MFKTMKNMNLIFFFFLLFRKKGSFKIENKIDLTEELWLQYFWNLNSENIFESKILLSFPLYFKSTKSYISKCMIKK